MSDLTDFLLARIAEDETVAREAAWQRHCWIVESDDSGEVHGVIEAGIGGDPVCDGTGLGEAEHIARHDPARVLAECEAKRRIVGRHRQSFDICAGDCAMRETSPCPTLRLLALPYADHPDYRDEWRP